MVVVAPSAVVSRAASEFSETVYSYKVGLSGNVGWCSFTLITKTCTLAVAESMSEFTVSLATI